MSSTLSNPLDDFPDLKSSNDPSAQIIVTNFNIMYDNILIMNKSEDVSILNNAAIKINKSWNIIINYIKPCATISNSDKCSLPVCNWVKEIEQLYIKFLLLLYGLNTDEIKKNYQFLPFFITNEFVTMISSNSSNKIPNLFPVKYKLCTLNTYLPPTNASPSMTNQWNLLIKEMTVQQNNVNNAVSTLETYNFLLYILLPIVIIILLILLYIKYNNNKKIQETALK